MQKRISVNKVKGEKDLKKVVKIAVLILTFIIIASYRHNIYAANQIIKVDFDDKTLYNMIIEQIGDSVLNKDDNNYTIDIDKDEMKKITELSFDASSYQTEDFANIHGIERFIWLEKLEIINYKLDNIEVLKYLPNLKELTINNCQLSDIQPIGEMVNLRKLDLGNNEISDIKALNTLKNLTKLKINENQIIDISPIKDLDKLTGIDLSSNQISDISALKNLKKITMPDKIYDTNILPEYLMKLINFEYLYLDNNQIRKISSIDKDILKYTSAKNQRITVKTNKTEEDLSNTFFEEKDIINNNIELNNCKIDMEKSKIKIDDKNKPATVKIIDGVLRESVLIFDYDQKSPSVIVNYGEIDNSTQTMKVVISSDEEIRPIDGWVLEDNRRKLIKTYSKNMTEKLEVYDIAGNKTKQSIRVQNINRPILETTYTAIEDASVAKGQQIIAEADKYVGVTPYVLQGDSFTTGIDCSHFVYRILQMCGLYDGKYIRSTNWIDVGEEVQDLEHAIAGDVIVWDGHVAFYDGYGKIVEAKGKKWGVTHDRDAAKAIEKKTFLGIRRFTGNEKIEKVLNSKETTNGDVRVTINSNKKIKPIAGWKLSKDEKVLTKTFKKNTNEIVTIKDYDDNEVNVNINITNIYK